MQAPKLFSRLDGSTREQAEIALRVRGDRALAEALARAAPGSSPHVAFSLDDPLYGPFLVVPRGEQGAARCLGEGVTPRAADRFSRARLDRTLAEAAGADPRAGGLLDPLLERVAGAGPYLAREDFDDFAAIAALVRGELATALEARALAAEEARVGLARLLARVDKVKPTEFGRLAAYWNLVWSLGHIAFALVEDAPDYVASLLQTSRGVAASLTLPLVKTGTFGLALRAAWIEGKLGAARLEPLARALATGQRTATLFNAVFGLLALAFRHPALGADVRAALVAPAESTVGPIAAYAAWLVKCAHVALDEAEAPRCAREIGGAKWVRLADRVPPGSPLRFERAEDVPEAIALPAAFLSQIDLLADARAGGVLALAVAEIAPRDAADLHLPREAASAVFRPPDPDETIGILQGWRRVELNRKAAAPAPAGPPRQGPCPCGSGKKFKRCCEGKRTDGAE